jgi:hypothetical protein
LIASLKRPDQSQGLASCWTSCASNKERRCMDGSTQMQGIILSGDAMADVVDCMGKGAGKNEPGLSA